MRRAIHHHHHHGRNTLSTTSSKLLPLLLPTCAIPSSDRASLACSTAGIGRVASLTCSSSSAIPRAHHYGGADHCRDEHGGSFASNGGRRPSSSLSLSSHSVRRCSSQGGGVVPTMGLHSEPLSLGGRTFSFARPHRRPFSDSSGSGDGNPNDKDKSSATPTTPPTAPPAPAPKPPKKAKKITTLSLASKKRRGKKISMVTAYDYPSALHVDRAGIDVVLVGDSCAMVELGFDTTLPITLDQMIHHCRAVKRGAPNRPLLVGDMPFGTYEFADVDIALRNAYRMVQEGGMDAVKFEGGSVARAKTVRHVVDGGVAVLGHVGLTPQAIGVLGGFRAQGRTALRARALLDDALRLQDAGAFAIVLECVPSNVASAITDALEVPTIGIGAGGGTSGQVLVFHDLLGMTSHPHHEEFVPKFCKQYARVGFDIHEGLERFRRDVEGGTFPGETYSPYVMTEEERHAFDELLAKDAEKRHRRHEEAALKLKQTDEYEQLSLYGNRDGNGNRSENKDDNKGDDNER